MIYKCSNCDFTMNETDMFCPNCGGAVVKDYIGAGVKAEVVDINKVDMIQYVKVVPINPNELEIANTFIKAIPELNIEYKDYLLLCYKDNYVLKISGNNISFILTKDDKKKYINNPMFINQINKKEVFWKTTYMNGCIDKYIELIKNRMNSL